MQLATYLAEDRGRLKSVGLALGVSPAFISQVACGRRACPAERATSIEKATGGAVRRWDLRPTDWHEIWPELLGADGAPPVPSPEAEVRDAA